MAARRRHDQRRRRRRGRFSFLYKLLSVLLIFAAILVGSIAFFRVNHIEVVGNSRYSAQAVIDASGVELGDNLFLVNRPQTASAIMRALPYVETATPVHHLPDTVELRITECVSVAALRVEGAWWLIDARGKLLERGEKETAQGLPVVSGLQLTDPAVGSRMTVALEEEVKLEGLKQLLSALSKRNMIQGVTEFIDLSSSNAIYFGYGEDLTVEVPMSGDFDLRIFSLQRVLETFSERGERVTGTLDLTYGDDRARLLTDRWLPQ